MRLQYDAVLRLRRRPQEAGAPPSAPVPSTDGRCLRGLRGLRSGDPADDAILMLRTELHLERPDDFYEALIETHRGLTREQSELVNCKLILLLANHVGDANVLGDAMRRARDGVLPADASASGTPGDLPTTGTT